MKKLLLVFSYPKDSFEGLLSDWIKEIPGVKRIVISEDFKVNGKKCRISGWDPVKEGHDMSITKCFQYYNPVILKYIASRIK